MRRQVVKSLVFVCVLMFYNAALAQQIPSSARAERLTRETPVDRVPNKIEPTKPYRVVKDVEFIKAPKGAENIKFKLKNVRVKGVKAYKKEDIKKIYKQYIGKTITLKTLYDIANDITHKYHEDGYIFSKAIIPAQEIDGGNVKIKVHEGAIHKINLKGYQADNFISKAVKKRILAIKPLDVDILEGEILKLNDLLGVSFRTILKPSKKQGMIDLTIIGEKQKNQFDLVFNNNGTKFIGPLQSTVSVKVFHSKILPFNETKIDYTVAKPRDELEFVRGTHSLPINSYGTMLSISGTYSSSEPGHTLKSNEIDTDSFTASATLSHPIYRSRERTVRADLAFTSRNTDTDILGTALTKDRIRSVKLGVDIENYDDYQGVSFLNFDLTQGVEAFGGSKKGDQNLSRSTGNPKFTKYEAVLTRLQSLGPSFAILGTVYGQFSDDSLLSSEEVGYGGKNIGRAYDASEITGDKGIMGSIELRYYDVPNISEAIIQPYIFYDIGKVWHNDNTAKNQASAASAGGGVRLSHKKSGLSAEGI